MNLGGPDGICVGGRGRVADSRARKDSEAAEYGPFGGTPGERDRPLTGDR